MNNVEHSNGTIMSGSPSWLPFLPGLIIGILLIAAWGLGLIIIAIVVWRRYSMNFELTAKNLKVETGILIKNETQVRVKDIRGISIKRGIFDAITGCGTIIVGTAATADAEIIIPHICGAKALQEKINQLRDNEA